MLSQNMHTVYINNNLYRQIEKVKTQKKYKDDTQATEEIIRAGIEYLKEQAEDEYLLALALERKKNDNGIRWSAEEVYEEFGIFADDLDEIPMEYGVDFQ